MPLLCPNENHDPMAINVSVCQNVHNLTSSCAGNASYITWTMLRVQNDGAAEATNEITQLPAVA